MKSSADGGDTVRFQYAQLLNLVRCQGYTVATIRHPWRQDAVLHRYVLVPADSVVPGQLCLSGKDLRIIICRGYNGFFVISM